jgi:hypothetical protein
VIASLFCGRAWPLIVGPRRDHPRPFRVGASARSESAAKASANWPRDGWDQEMFIREVIEHDVLRAGGMFHMKPRKWHVSRETYKF